jgi:hypothetical protein
MEKYLIYSELSEILQKLARQKLEEEKEQAQQAIHLLVDQMEHILRVVLLEKKS